MTDADKIADARAWAEKRAGQVPELINDLAFKLGSNRTCRWIAGYGWQWSLLENDYYLAVWSALEACRAAVGFDDVIERCAKVARAMELQEASAMEGANFDDFRIHERCASTARKIEKQILALKEPK